MFDILVSDITRIVKAKEKRGKRNEQSYQDLTNAVRYLLKILWDDSTSTPVRRSGFHFTERIILFNEQIYQSFRCSL